MCRTESIVYEAAVTTDADGELKVYRGATENEFKLRYPAHTLSFNNENYKNSTELSKYIWQLKGQNRDFSIEWKILKNAKPYVNGSKRCNLCLTEKLEILNGLPSELLNKRSELVSKCRHENKFLLRNLKVKTSNNDPAHMHGAVHCSAIASIDLNGHTDIT